MLLVEKIQKVRCGLKNARIKMTGNNTYAGYKYFELDDFLPILEELMLQHKMTAIPSFTAEYATLTAYDLESDATLVITSPMGSASLKGCHEVQNIGAVETYQRRYLYQAMFDISESDALNKTQGRPERDKERKEETNEGEKMTRAEELPKFIKENSQDAKATNVNIKDYLKNELEIKTIGEMTDEQYEYMKELIKKGEL